MDLSRVWALFTAQITSLLALEAAAVTRKIIHHLLKPSIRVGIIQVTWAWGHNLSFKRLDNPVHGGPILWC